MQGKIVGVDVGGTFTDLVAIDSATQTVSIAKTPSTMTNQAFGVMTALDEAGVDLAEVDLIVHGTTTTTNAILERKLAKTGLITTRGFRDILELGRRTRPQPYGMTGVFHPIIPRDLRLEVEERMDAEGKEVTALDEAGVEQAAKELLAKGCEAVVIHFLHAYANPTHELAAKRVVETVWPNGYITLGHALLSESREFERGVTAAVNASVQPILERYIDRLRTELKTHGYRGELLVVNGNGGTVSAAAVAAEAAKTVMSGPASGVIAAAATGRQAGFSDLITYDMGGTSTDVALVRGAEPAVSSEIEVEYALPIHVPMVDVRTVGAGGGSIARVNAGGLLEVGPQSAGAEPGPICYGRGGLQPTITDANLLLGRLDSSRLNSIEAFANPERLRTIFDDKLGRPLGLDAEQAAAAVIRLANTKMAGAIRMVSLSLGADPRDFALFAFGGAGPLHASSLAKELGIPKVLAPARPGITNALGCVLADLRHDFVRTLNRALNDIKAREVHAIFSDQARAGETLLDNERVEIVERRYLRSVDMQFAGQSHILRVAIDAPKPTLNDIKRAFDQVYFERFRIELPGVPVNLVNINTSVIGRRRPVDLAALVERREPRTAGRRKVYFDGDWLETMIYDRHALEEGAAITGPAILEQMDTTILVEPGDRAVCDDIGNIVIEVAK